MNDVIPMAVIQRAANLPRELPSHSFAQAPMTDNVIQHLAAVDVFENHIIMVLVNDHLSHATDIRMVEKHRQRCFAKCSGLFRGVL